MHHGHEEGVLAPDEVADPPEHQRPERPHREPRGERGEREDEAGGLVDAREELRGDDRGEQAVEVEVVPLEDRAERAGGDHLDLRGLQRRARRRLRSCAGPLPMFALTVPEWPVFNPPRVRMVQSDTVSPLRGSNPCNSPLSGIGRVTLRMARNSSAIAFGSIGEQRSTAAANPGTSLPSMRRGADHLEQRTVSARRSGARCRRARPCSNAAPRSVTRVSAA